jgi:hypothetical protein
LMLSVALVVRAKSAMYCVSNLALYLNTKVDISQSHALTR